MSLIRNRCRGLVTAVLLLAVCAAAPGRDVITLGPSDGAALDQPRVKVEVFDPVTGASLGPSDGWLYTPNIWLLDTGAQGVVAAGIAVEDLEAAGYQTDATFLEQGVAGYALMDISAPYDVVYQPVPSEPFDWDDWLKSSGPMTLRDVRMLSSPSADFGGFGGIMGMPGMLGHAVTVDNEAVITDLQVGVEFNPALPAGAGHRYAFDLEMREYPPTGQVEPNDPPPTYAPLPMLHVEAFHDDNAAGGSWLLDTGAQISMIASHTAFRLGLDADGDGTFDEEALEWITVGGVGGSAMVPVLAFDQIRLSDGQNDLVTTDMQVLVVDIDESIDGVFGMDLLTSGWGSELFGEGFGQLDRVHFDFTAGADGPAGLIYDVTPELDTPVSVATRQFTGPSTGSADWSDTSRWQLGEPNAREDADLTGSAVVTAEEKIRRLRIGADGLGPGRLTVDGGTLSAMRVIVGSAGYAGELVVTPGSRLRADLGLTVLSGGQLSGGGEIVGDVTNEGTILLVGQPMTIDGGFSLTSAGRIETGWADDGGDPNAAGLVVGGRAEVSGTIHLLGAAVLPGEVRTILLADEIAGTPGAILAPAGPAGLWYEWQTTGQAGRVVSVALSGDATLDGLVDVGDLAILAVHWNTSGADWSTADFTGDGVVDVGDLGLLAAGWGAKVQIPEPAALSLLTAGSLLIVLRRRNR